MMKSIPMILIAIFVLLLGETDDYMKDPKAWIKSYKDLEPVEWIIQIAWRIMFIAALALLPE